MFNRVIKAVRKYLKKDINDNEYYGVQLHLHPDLKELLKTKK